MPLRRHLPDFNHGLFVLHVLLVLLHQLVDVSGLDRHAVLVDIALGDELDLLHELVQVNGLT